MMDSLDTWTMDTPMTIVQSLVLHTTQQKDVTVEHIMTPIQVILTRNWLFMCNEDLKQTWTLNIWECWGYSIILEFPLKNSFLTTDYPVCLFKEEMDCLKKVKGQSLHGFLGCDNFIQKIQPYFNITRRLLILLLEWSHFLL